MREEPTGPTDGAAVRSSTPTRAGVPADQTDIQFQPFVPKQWVPPDYATTENAPIPQELSGAVNEFGELDLTRVTPDMMAAMDPVERKGFFDLLGEQGSTFSYPGYPESRSAPTNFMGLADSLALHLMRQDPSGGTAADIFATNPDLIADLHNKLTAGPDYRDEASSVAQSLFANLDRSFQGTEVDENHAKALQQVASQHMRDNDHNPEAFAQLLEAADEATSRMPPETAHFNSGALAASVLAGVRDSGQAPFEALVGWPGRLNPAGIVSSILLKGFDHLTNTTGEAAANYNSLYDAIVEGYNNQSDAAGNDPLLLRQALDERDGFTNGMSWLR